MLIFIINIKMTVKKIVNNFHIINNKRKDIENGKR